MKSKELKPKGGEGGEEDRSGTVGVFEEDGDQIKKHSDFDEVWTSWYCISKEGLYLHLSSMPTQCSLSSSEKPKEICVLRSLRRG